MSQEIKSSLENRRVLVSGGAGFIGSHLVDRLLREKCGQVIVLDDFSTGSMKNLEASSKSPNLKVVKGDLKDKEVLKSVLKDVEIVFHEAALTPSASRPLLPSYLNQVNVMGTINLLEYSARSGVERFVFASSAEVYGKQSKLPIREEESELIPVSPNGWSKLLGERACFEFYAKTGIKATALRYYNVYGQRSEASPCRGVVNEFAERLLSMESPIIYGKGGHVRDFVHVEDIVEANILAAKGNCAGRAYNVGSGEPMSIEALAELESRILLGDNVIIPLDYKLAKQIDVPNVYGDISLVKKELGYVPKYSIEKGLEKYLSFLGEFLKIEIERPVPIRRM